MFFSAWNPDMTSALIGKGNIFGWLVVQNRGHSGSRLYLYFSQYDDTSEGKPPASVGPGVP